VRESFRGRSVRARFHRVEVSYLEGALTRGDRRLGPVIETAWRHGARFDGWDEQLKLDVWLAAFQTHGLNPDEIALRARGLDEVLPWVVVSDTVSTGFLKREWQRSQEEAVTPGCGCVLSPPGSEGGCVPSSSAKEGGHESRRGSGGVPGEGASPSPPDSTPSPRVLSAHVGPLPAGARAADPEPGPCAVCDACARSPLYFLKLAFLEAPLKGRPRDSEYTQRNWPLPPGAGP